MKHKEIKLIVLWNWDLIINRGDDCLRSSTGGWLKNLAGSQSKWTIHRTSSNVVNNVKPTMFSLAVFFLKELLINESIASVCWFFLLNNVSGAKGSEISQMHLVTCWYHAVNYFEYIWDFPSDLLQWGMFADGLLLHIYCHGQGEKDCLVVWKCALCTPESLGRLNSRNLVLLAGKLRKRPFHSTSSLLFMSLRETHWNHLGGVLRVVSLERSGWWWSEPGSEDMVLGPSSLWFLSMCYFDLGHIDLSVF